MARTGLRITSALDLLLHPNECRQRLARRVQRVLNGRRLDHALRAVNGVIHVGANTGQERDMYAAHDLAVLWVEPIPTMFTRLQQNIAGYPRQHCVNALVSNEDGREFTLHIASNDGASSSILDFADHRDIWPDVHYVDEMRSNSVTLPTLLGLERLQADQYEMLTLDTQGSELIILKGAVPLLPCFQYVRTEVADFESYIGCAKRHELTEFLTAYGFKEWAVEPFAERKGGGQYFDILYRRT